MRDPKIMWTTVYGRVGPKGLAAVVAVILAIGFGGYKIFEHVDTGGLGYFDATDLVAADDVEVDIRKRTFFERLAPVVEAENIRILDLREKLQVARENESTATWIADIAEEYGMDEWNGKAWNTLMARVDAVPVPLALIQAAKESNWGRSRFARQGNNLFGQWCFSEGCGLVPKRRPEEAIHEVQAFGSINHAVRAYLNNINSHRAYRDLRKVRARARAAGKTATSIDLAKTLLSYSERGQAYVNDIIKLIKANRKLMPTA